MTRAEVLQKIRKCLALAASANEHEAAAALAKARELMDAHGVTESDVALADVFEERVRRATSAARPPVWEADLIHVVADTFGVAPLIEGTEVIFAGTGAAPTVATYAFTMVRRILAAKRKAYIARALRRCKLATKRVRADHFCRGFVRGIETEMVCLMSGPIDCPLGKQWLAERYSSAPVRARPPAATRSTRVQDDFLTGFDAGSEVTLHQGLGDSGAALERMRRHREAFEYGVEHGLSLREAEAELAQRRWLQAQCRLTAQRLNRATTAQSDRWMMRD